MTGSPRARAARGLAVRVLARPRRFVLILSAALLLATLLSHTPLYAEVGRWLGDAVHALTAERVRYEDVLVVDIDEAAMAALAPRLGAWPFPRDVHARVLDHLFDAGARAVVLDVLLVEAREGDAALAAALARHRDVWLAARGQDFALARDEAFQRRLDRHAWPAVPGVRAQPWSDVLLPHPSLERVAGVGLISVKPDVDGVLRRIAPLHEVSGRVLPALALAPLFDATQRPALGHADGDLLGAGRRWPLDHEGRVLLRVPRNRDFLRVVGFDRVLAAAEGVAALDPDTVRGRTVFIGSSAAVLGDYAQLPLHGRTSGLGILALAFASLANGTLLRPPGPVLDLLLALLAGVLPLLYTNRRRFTEVAITLWAVLGMGGALTVHVAAFGWWQRPSDALFALTLGACTLAVQLAFRFRTLYAERHQLWLDKRAADEANALKSRFLAHMTHELRTPLTAIAGYNRLLAEPRVSDAERAERTAVVARNCDHLMALINNLLDQARIEAGQMSVEVEPTVIRELLDQCRATLAPLAQDKQLALDARCGPEVPEAIAVDPLRLRQVLINLIGNAIKFTERGGVQVDVDWHAQRLVARVRDTGPGMDAAALRRIFDAFQQADATVQRSHGGTGLGLTISRNLAQMMDGSLGVESTPGRGTTFTLEIAAPRAAAPPRAAPPPAADAPTGAHVLLVDDTADIRELFGLHLRRLGHRVETADNGQDALTLALAGRPRVVLMDVEMPRMDGIAATRALRAAGYSGKILALTGHADADILQRLRDAGCDGVVSKPVSREGLAAALAEHLAPGQ